MPNPVRHAVTGLFYIHNWNMVQLQDIQALFYSMQLLQSLMKMFQKHYLFMIFLEQESLDQNVPEDD